MTPFAGVDGSSFERTGIVEDKVLTVAGRVAQMFGVEMNPAINVGREVFVQRGSLSRPSVLGSGASEAVLRGWLSSKEVVLMGFLHIMSGNLFIGLFFHWSHADIVFSRADKATGLFAGLLLTFISTALLVDLDGSDEFGADALLEVFVSAVATQVLLLPFKHVLPYMISNINTVTMNTHQGIGLLKRQMNKVQQILCCGGGAKKLRHKKDVQVATLDKWLTLMAESHVEHESQSGVRHDDDIMRTSTSTDFKTFHNRKHARHRQLTQRLRKQYMKSQLFIFKWCITLPDAGDKKRDAMRLSSEQARSMKLDRIDAGVVGQIGRLQTAVREWLRERKLIRQAEFAAWFSGMKWARQVMGVLAAIQLLYILAVGLAVCLAFSYAFEENGCWAWLSAAGISVLMQLFVTNPVLGTVMLVSKLLMGWLLLGCEIRAQRKRRLGVLDEKGKSLELTELKSVEEIKVVNAKLKALEMVADGDEEVVEMELEKREAEKVRVEGNLAEVGESIEEARVDGLNDVVKKLKKDERDIKTSLRAVEVALEALVMFGAEGVEAEELLVEAKRERSQLTAQLKRIRRKKGQVDVQRTRLANVDSGKGVKDVRKIVPFVARESDEEDARESDMEHVDVDRAEMPRVGRVGRERSGGVDVVPRRKLRRRRVRVIRRLKRGNVTKKLSSRFLKKVMEYRARRERLAREVELAEV